MLREIKVIAFDADDTLWVNEPYFQEIEARFCDLMEHFHPRHTISRELLATEIRNLDLYGFGIKSFMLSMIESAIEMSGGTIGIEVIHKIISFGKEMLQKPVELIEGVQEVLTALNGTYRLVLATKGDLLDQERKLILSGLQSHFHHIEILTDKKEANYAKLIRHLDILPGQFMMVGNSLKSDVLPVLTLGGYACHIPFHTTWDHEKIDYTVEHERFLPLTTITDLIKILS